uniref:Uncharacterized protein n=1 Tax=Chromera velia CCMP2878 TaxID=1169474 RepID=A0A0G4HY20_9ALVE|eukprot:Cvel_1515.t1-p1 / transcript=Cvel_1515.t1 / gene=Cvel_1515 / organism=Chromera_velia_CCMP2878 / gene_product=hypothetical protein / transcript_product=hypothetical protein / location=Cvel_scaffold53:105891-106169(-) / protein_length=93 / sequence_SO=supercontig / SO=protein_coding / is_pseudo=false
MRNALGVLRANLGGTGGGMANLGGLPRDAKQEMLLFMRNCFGPAGPSLHLLTAAIVRTTVSKRNREERLATREGENWGREMRMNPPKLNECIG